MQQIDIERGQEFRKCIECFMCQDVCHVIRDHEDNKASYAGPRMFIRFMELESHPLDTDDRRELLRQRMGLGLCNITKCCTEVCPEHIKITDNAIIPLKERVVDSSYDPVAWLVARSCAAPSAAPSRPPSTRPGTTPTRQEQQGAHGLSVGRDGAGHRPELSDPDGRAAPPVTGSSSAGVGRGLQRRAGRRGAVRRRGPRPAWRCRTGASAWARS